MGLVSEGLDFDQIEAERIGRLAPKIHRETGTGPKRRKSQLASETICAFLVLASTGRSSGRWEGDVIDAKSSKNVTNKKEKRGRAKPGLESRTFFFKVKTFWHFYVSRREMVLVNFIIPGKAFPWTPNNLFIARMTRIKKSTIGPLETAPRLNLAVLY